MSKAVILGRHIIGLTIFQLDTLGGSPSARDYLTKMVA
jgi:hypothetical protein